jgi:hypothetical protein
MAKEWTHVRISRELHEQLVQTAAEMLNAHVEGRISLPADQCERVSLAYVIQTALRERQSHQERARRPKTRSNAPVNSSVAMLTRLSPEES